MPNRTVRNNNHTNLRVIFAGRDNSFNRGFCLWLKENFSLEACFFLEGDRFSLKGRWKRIRGRIRRLGLIRVLDELMFHLFDRLILRSGEKARWEREIPDRFSKSHRLDVPCNNTSNIHAKKWISEIKSIEPDLIISLCGSVIFKKKFYDIPKYGTFVLHEGLTPEYRGLHTPLWALMNGEPQYIGFTLLKINDTIDGGEIIVQSRYTPCRDEGIKTWSLVGHKAIINGLPAIKEALDRLAIEGGFHPVPQDGRLSSYYSWMTLSKYLSLRLRKIRDTTGSD